MNEPTATTIQQRVDSCARAWNIIIDERNETPSSVIAFGRRGDESVVLKVVREPGDEWRSGDVIAAFDGHAMVRVLERTDGAMLLERLTPATPLAAIALDGRDDEATEILADVIRRMSHPNTSLEAFTTVEEWGLGFERYLQTADASISRDLVEHAQRTYFDLCVSQRDRRLLHGDLQHYNILFDAVRGWTAIDPKGVVGEVEYELGASMRNPCEQARMFITSQVVEQRLARMEAALKLDAARVLAWCFSQAVLSAIWLVEDGYGVAGDDASLLLARVTRGML